MKLLICHKKQERPRYFWVMLINVGVYVQENIFFKGIILVCGNANIEKTENKANCIRVLVFCLFGVHDYQ